MAACATCASFFDADELELEALRTGGLCPACRGALDDDDGGGGAGGGDAAPVFARL